MLTINHNITGGNWEFIVDGNTNFTVNSVAPFYNVNMRRIDGSGDVSLEAPLVVLNNLILENGIFQATSDHNVTIGGNFNLQSGSTYTPDNNTTRFNGSKNQSFTLNGSIGSGGLYNLAIDKPSDTLNVF